MNHIQIVGSVMALALAGSACAQIRVDRDSGSGFGNDPAPAADWSFQFDSLAGGYNVFLNVPADNLVYRIYATSPATTDIAHVQVGSTVPGRTVTVLLGDASVTGPNPDVAYPITDSACNNWTNGIRPDPTNPIDIKLQARIRGDFSYLGIWQGSNAEAAIDVLQIIRLDVEGDILQNARKFNQNFEHRSTTLPLFAITCNRVQDTRITSHGGEIRLVRANMFNDEFSEDVAMGPSIGIENLAGDIGTVEAPFGRVEASELGYFIRATGRISEVTARSIDGLISSSSGPEEVGGVGIHRIRVTGTQWYEGILSGSVRAPRIIPDDNGNPGYIDVNGDLSGGIRLWDGLPECAIIRVGGTFDSTGPATTPINLGTSDATDIGLAGQIIINGNDSGGEWVDAIGVFIDPETFEPVYTLNPALNYPQTYDYPELAAQLGGGAVGVVPYILYGVDAAPVDGANLAFTSRPTVASPIRVPHYGPVSYVEAGAQDQPFRVFRRLKCAGGAWTPFNNPAYKFTFDPDTNNPRIVVATPFVDAGEVPFAGGYEYKVEPVREQVEPDRLQTVVTVDGANGPVVFESDEYTFGVGLDCPEDINASGAIDIADLNYVLAYWGRTSGVPGDVNNSFTIDFNDLNAIINKFGVTNCACAGMMMGAPGNGGGESMMAGAMSEPGEGVSGAGDMPALVSAMGFTSLAEFESFVNALADEGILSDVLPGMIEEVTE